MNNDILYIYQDSRGFIWLCTRGGLSRYDGSRFVNFTTTNGLTNNMINDIIEIAPQEFIIAQNSEGPRLLKNDHIGPIAADRSTVINKIYKLDKGRLVGTADKIGLVERDKGQFKPVNTDSKRSFKSLTVLGDSLWLLLDINFYAYLTAPLLQEKSPMMPVSATCIYTDSHLRTWVGTMKGLKLLDPAVKPDNQLDYPMNAWVHQITYVDNINTPTPIVVDVSAFPNGVHRFELTEKPFIAAFRVNFENASTDAFNYHVKIVVDGQVKQHDSLFVGGLSLGKNTSNTMLNKRWRTIGWTRDK